MDLIEPRESNILVSFIIPFYRGKDFIKRCVAGLMQVALSKEILIIDDGSPDDSFIFCKQTFSDEKEIKLHSKENGGVASARNYGLNIAIGKYVVFVDQDDIIVPEVLTKAIDIMESTNNQILFWDTQCILPSGQHISNTHSLFELNVERKEIINEVIPTFLYKRNTKLKCELGPVWGAIFLRNFINSNDITFKSFVAYEDDHLFIFDALSFAEKIYFLPETGYYWNIRNESTSHKKNKISGYVERALASNKYRLERFKLICEDETIIEEYQTYVEQSVILSAINNVCSYYAWDWKEVRAIRKLLYDENFIKAFKEKELMNRNNYTRLVYILIKLKLDYMAYMFSYVNSIRNSLNKR